jgi:hypothetical protein
MTRALVLVLEKVERGVEEFCTEIVQSASEH